MTSTPWMGCILSSLERTSSAGGQLEQPSDVKRSTTTGVTLAPALPFPFFLQPTSHTIKTAPAIASTARNFFFMVPFIFISKTPHQLLVSKLLRIGSGRARQ